MPKRSHTGLSLPSAFSYIFLVTRKKLFGKVALCSTFVYNTRYDNGFSPRFDNGGDRAPAPLYKYRGLLRDSCSTLSKSPLQSRAVVVSKTSSLEICYQFQSSSFPSLMAASLMAKSSCFDFFLPLPLPSFGIKAVFPNSSTVWS